MLKREKRALVAAPCALHPTPYTLHPTPYTLHPTPHTLHTLSRMLKREKRALVAVAEALLEHETLNGQQVQLCDCLRTDWLRALRQSLRALRQSQGVGCREKRALVAVAEALLEHETLNGQQVTSPSTANR